MHGMATRCRNSNWHRYRSALDPRTSDRRFAAARTWLVIGLVTAVYPSVSWGQANYKRYPYDAALRSAGNHVKSVLNGDLPLQNPSSGDPAKTNGELMVDYFKKYRLPLMSQPGARIQPAVSRGSRPRTTVTDMRIDLTRILDKARSAEALAAANNIVRKYMIHYAVTGEIHPTLRYNAVLALGSLNSRSPAMAAGDQGPEPLANVTPILHQLITTPKFRTGEPIPDALRVAALIGLVRHSRYGLADERAEQAVSTALLKVLQQQELPPGRGRPEHEWMRGLAAQALSYLGGNQTIVEALVAALNEEDASLSFRCRVTAAITRLKVADDQIDATPVARSVGQFALASCLHEQQLLEAEEAALLEANPRFQDRGVLDDEDEATPKAKLGRLAFRLDVAEECCKQLATWAAPPADDLGNRLSEASKQGQRRLAKPKMDDTQLLAALPEITGRFQGLLGAGAAETADTEQPPPSEDAPPEDTVPDLSDDLF